MSNGWIQVDKTAKPPLVKRKVVTSFAFDLVTWSAVPGGHCSRRGANPSQTHRIFGTDRWQCQRSDGPEEKKTSRRRVRQQAVLLISWLSSLIVYPVWWIIWWWLNQPVSQRMSPKLRQNWQQKCCKGTRLTQPMFYDSNLRLSSGSWKSLNFKQYNFNAKGIVPPFGCLHPLLKVRSEYRQIFLEMGYIVLDVYDHRSSLSRPF